jgi:hypothetical protein
MHVKERLCARDPLRNLWKDAVGSRDVSPVNV